jgi:hypothetical protein
MKIIKEMVEMFPIRKRPIYGLCKSLWLALSQCRLSIGDQIMCIDCMVVTIQTSSLLKNHKLDLKYPLKLLMQVTFCVCSDLIVWMNIILTIIRRRKMLIKTFIKVSFNPQPASFLALIWTIYVMSSMPICLLLTSVTLTQLMPTISP